MEVFWFLIRNIWKVNVTHGNRELREVGFGAAIDVLMVEFFLNVS